MGLDLGIEQTGKFELLACVEKVPAFCETIRRNRDARRIGNKSLRVYESDVSELDPLSLLSDLKMFVGELDLIAGGPPCQAFSVFGKRRGLQDDRGRLILDFVRFVGCLVPRTFIMENVRGLLSMKASGSNRKGSLFELVRQEFNKHGYRTDCFVVNSVNYGAPQIRERIFLIGNRYDLVADFLAPTHSDRPSDRLPPFATLGDAIRGKHDPDPTVMQFSARKQSYLAMVPAGGNWRSLPIEIQKESMGKSFYLKGGRSAHWRKLSFDFPCPTVMTLPNHAGTSMCHPELLRPLTVGECARVQEFPLDWEFAGTAAERYQQVGNAVPIALGKHAAESVAVLLDRVEISSAKKQQTMVPDRIIHLRPHVRTRWWWKDGKVIDAVPYSQRPSGKNKQVLGRTLFD